MSALNLRRLQGSERRAAALVSRLRRPRDPPEIVSLARATVRRESRMSLGRAGSARAIMARLRIGDRVSSGRAECRRWPLATW